MAFADALLALTGTATDSFDIVATVRRCFKYDFASGAVYIWDGQGILTTEDGQEWIGTIDADGVNHHNTPAVRDPRDGTSPRYEFSIPYLDAATYAAMKADQSVAAGRDIICYHALFNAKEGLLPQTPIRFAWKMTIRGVTFSEAVEENSGQFIASYNVTALARSLEYGRSRTPAGTFTDTAQNERARVLGVASDSGCSFMARNANRTFLIEGT